MPGRQNGQLLEVRDPIDGRRAAEDMCSHCLRLPAGQDLRPARARAARAGGCRRVRSVGTTAPRNLGCLDRRGPRERANIRGGEGRAGGPPRSFEGRAPKKKSEARASDPACRLCGDGSGAGGAWGCRLASVSGVPRGAFAMASRSPYAADVTHYRLTPDDAARRRGR